MTLSLEKSYSLLLKYLNLLSFILSVFTQLQAVFVSF